MRGVLDWGIGEVCWHTWHGRCIVKDIMKSAIGGWLDPVLIVIREHDGEPMSFHEDDVRELTPIAEWDASKELKRLAERT